MTQEERFEMLKEFADYALSFMSTYALALTKELGKAKSEVYMEVLNKKTNDYLAGFSKILPEGKPL